MRLTSSELSFPQQQSWLCMGPGQLRVDTRAACACMRSLVQPADIQPAVALLAACASSRSERLMHMGASASVTVINDAAQSEKKPHLARYLSWEATRMDGVRRGRQAACALQEPAAASTAFDSSGRCHVHSYCSA